MDIRPVIHFWLNKPDAYDNGETSIPKARMKAGPNQGKSPEDEGFHQTGWTNRKWGSPHESLDLWMDIDRCIGRLGMGDHMLFVSYVKGIGDFHSDWAEWELPPERLAEALSVILSGTIDNEGKEL